MPTPQPAELNTYSRSAPFMAELGIELVACGEGRLGAVVKPGRQMMYTEAAVFAIEGVARALLAATLATMAVAEA